MEITITLSQASRKFLEYYIGKEFERNKGYVSALGDGYMSMIYALVSNCEIADLKKLEAMKGERIKLPLPKMLQVSKGGYRATPHADPRGNFVWIEPSKQILLDGFFRGLLRAECKVAANRADRTGLAKKTEIISVLDKYDIEDSEFSLDAILRWLNRQKSCELI